MWFWPFNRMSLRLGLPWLTPNLTLTSQCLSWNYIYIYIFFFSPQFCCFCIPPKMSSHIPVEDHFCSVSFLSRMPWMFHSLPDWINLSCIMQNCSIHLELQYSLNQISCFRVAATSALNSSVSENIISMAISSSVQIIYEVSSAEVCHTYYALRFDV
jgi:hypothetical protein